MEYSRAIIFTTGIEKMVCLNKTQVNKLTNLCTLLNAVDMKKIGYGSYGSTGGYGYGYGYGQKVKKDWRYWVRYILGV